MGLLTQNYEIVRELGRGGMGAVYLANDKRLDRQVAIKMLQIDASVDQETASEIIQRFQKEARAIAKLNHPSIVSIYDIGEENNQYYMVIELLEGQALSNVSDKKQKISVEQVIDIGIQICSALAYAHKNGIVHRDIKPANIMFSPENIAKLTDFGIAQLGSDKLGLTQAGSILGSILYIPPEQLIDSRKVDKRADIYSLGVTLFQLATGRLPFEGESVAEVITKILNQDIPSMRKFSPDIPPELDQVILKAMKKEPNERFSEVTEFGDALKSVSEKLKNNSSGKASPVSQLSNDSSGDTAPLPSHTNIEISNKTVRIAPSQNTFNQTKKSTQKLSSSSPHVKSKASVPGAGKAPEKKNNTVPIVIGGLTVGIIALVVVLALVFGGDKKTEEPKEVIKPTVQPTKAPEKLKPKEPVKESLAEKEPETKPSAIVTPVAASTPLPVKKPVVNKVVATPKPVYRPPVVKKAPVSQPVKQVAPKKPASKPAKKPVAKPTAAEVKFGEGY